MTIDIDARTEIDESASTPHAGLAEHVFSPKRFLDASTDQVNGIASTRSIP